MIPLITCLVAQELGAPPELPREFRAAWVATVDNIDYPSKPGLPLVQMQGELTQIVNTAERLGLNAIIFQIRPHGDSFYKSQLEPWSYYLTGEQAKAPGDNWDPLKQLVDEAHAKGIEVHVWFNPYRANHFAQKGPIHASHIARTHPGVVYDYGTFKWMDPGAKVVQDRSYNVFLDVVKRYDIDGVHIDDYFYPYPVRQEGKLVPFPDHKTYADYRSRGGKLSISDWRRKNVDDFVERVYKGIKTEKPWVKFGISPFGIYRPGIPAGITAGVDQYEDLAADCLKWFREGWCDYFTPQLYWPIEQEKQSFPVLLNYWREQNPKGRHLWPGLFTSQVDPSGAKWQPSQVLRQIELTRKDHPGVAGHVHFSFKALQRNWAGIFGELKSSTYPVPAIMPASPWLSQAAVPAPKLTASSGRKVSWVENRGDRFYAVQAFGTDGKWRLIQYSDRADVVAPVGTTEIAVTTVNGFGTASKSARIAVKD